MPRRSDSQRIGSGGQRLVEQVIEKSRVWISRRQDEDFGIDLEAELAEPEASGQILKIQIKATETPEISARGVKVVVEKKYLRLAESLRIPFVFVVADITSDCAWYIWLQGWLIEQRRSGKCLESFADHTSVYIPEIDLLAVGLKGPLKSIARWQHKDQMILSLTDTIRTAVATHNEAVLVSLMELIGAIDSAYHDFPLESIIDSLVGMSSQPRATWETSILGRFLAIVGRSLGGRITKESVMRMTVPGTGPSRAGLVGLGALYDAHELHITGLNLPTAFEEAGYVEVAYYCRLREKFRGVKSPDLAFGEYDYTIGQFSIEVEDKRTFLNTWANRGESAYLDFLTTNERQP